MQRQGQIALFVILGVIIIAVFVFYRLAIIPAEKAPPIASEISAIPQVRAYLDQCLEISSKKALVSIGQKGGKLFLEAPYYSNDIISTNYLYSKNEIKMVNLETLNANLKNEVGERLEDCFSNFSAKGFEIKAGTPNVRVDLLESGTEILASYPIEILHNGMSQKIDRLEPLFFNVRLKLIYETAMNITKGIAANPNRIELVPLLEHEMNITIDMTPRNALFLIIDPLSSIEQKPYGFIFAVNFQDSTK